MPRIVRAHLGYSMLCGATLVLCVGINLVVFTVANALWIRPLPIPDIDRIVTLTDEGLATNDAGMFSDLENADHWPTFEAIAGQVVTTGTLESLRPRIVLGQVGHESEAAGVTSQYFNVLGQHVRGRTFSRAENRYGAEPVAVISYSLWANTFHRQPGYIGAVVEAKPCSFRIIGVAPPGFEGARRGEHIALWIPSNLIPMLSGVQSAIPENGVPTLMIARLRKGQHVGEAQRQLVVGASSNWESAIRSRLHVVPLSDVFGSWDARTVVIHEKGSGALVAGLAALVLFGGCTTIATLVLVHYERRRRELALRVALGATRARLVVEMYTELGWVGVIGVLGAVTLARWSLRLLPSFTLPGGVILNRLDLTIDWRVLLTAIVVTSFTLTAAAVIPIMHFARLGSAGTLVGSHSTPTRSSHRLRQRLLAIHVAVTLLILVSAGLFIRAVRYGSTQTAGFDVTSTVFVKVQVVQPFIGAVDDLDNRMKRVGALTTLLRAELASLGSAGGLAMGGSPIGSDEASLIVTPRVIQAEDQRRELRVGVLSGSPELVQVLGIPILRGRPLAKADAVGRPVPALVTVSLAQRLWGGDDALGRTLKMGARQAQYMIVGVTEDLVYGSLNEPSDGVLITATSEDSGGIEPRFVLRSDHPNLLKEDIRRAVERVIPNAGRVSISSGSDIIARDLGRQRLAAWFFSGFGIVVLLLGSVSVFGLVAYLAESRQRDFGVRLALGADPNALFRLGVRTGLAPVVLGTACGLPLAWVIARLFIGSLPGLDALDPITYAAVACLILGCASVSSTTAAFRFRYILPADALRTE